MPDKEELTALFAKIDLLNGSEADKLLIEHLANITGGFHTKLIETYQAADYWNKSRLIDSFPELKSIHSYYSESGFYEDFKHKFGL